MCDGNLAFNISWYLRSSVCYNEVFNTPVSTHLSFVPPAQSHTNTLSHTSHTHTLLHTHSHVGSHTLTASHKFSIVPTHSVTHSQSYSSQVTFKSLLSFGCIQRVPMWFHRLHVPVVASPVGFMHFLTSQDSKAMSMFGMDRMLRDGWTGFYSQGYMLFENCSALFLPKVSGIPLQCIYGDSLISKGHASGAHRKYNCRSRIRSA